ncbi:hypothetical protein E4U46_008196 [Claviceps purpurea]|nr:hypothetical protein E4U27_004735 [Claviceps purpurea]KAG6282592.1 hypothetical protein E4U46_008196 [Claviceps purpurea]
MFAFKLFLFAALAFLASITLAEVTGKFSAGSFYMQPKTDQHGHTQNVRTHQSWQFQVKVKSQRTLEKMSREFGTWSGQEFKCAINKYGTFYDVTATRDYPNRNAALDANQRARSILNAHKNEE